MPLMPPQTSTGIHLVTALGDEELTEQERIQLLQMLRLNNVPYHFGCNKEK